MSDPAPVVGATAPPTPTLLERLTRLGVTVLGTLPNAVLTRLAGTPTEIDGQRLEPEVQAALRILDALPEESFDDLPLDKGRRQIDVEAWQFGGRPLPVGSVRDLEIPGADAPIPARLYLPEGAGSDTAVAVYFHGGGFVLRSIASHDPVARFLAHRAKVAVLSVGYRLAREHPFPAGHEDAIASYAWAIAHAEELGLAPRIAVIGDSAGGNLAAIVSLAARDRGPPFPVAQILLSPWLDLASGRPSRTLFADGFFVTAAQIDWYRDKLLEDPALATDPRVSPLHADDLSGLPPTLFGYAGFDPIRDESRAYDARLREAGVEVNEVFLTGHVHPFSHVLGAGRTGKAATQEIARRLGELTARR